MLRRIIHIIVSLLLLLATTGMTITEHYCGGLLESVARSSNASSCCSDTSDCCHNENISYRVEIAFESLINKPDFSQSAIILPRLFLVEEALPVNITSTAFFKGPLPPDTHKLLSFLQKYLV